MLYVFIGSLIIAAILGILRSLYSTTYFLIVVGTFTWLYSIFFLEAKWQYQIVGIGMISIGIFLAHIWEELFRGKGKPEE